MPLSCGWAGLDVNQGPLLYQFYPRHRSVGQGAAMLGVVMGHAGSVCGGVAVIVAVSVLLS
jgi:hypothetical protein